MKEPKILKTRKVSPNSLANLKPIQPGEPSRGPNGRKGNDGNGGFSLKTSYKNYMKNLPEGAVNAVWQGLLFAAQQGNTNAAKMLIELGGEQISDNVHETSNGQQIIINIVDPKEKDDKD